MQRRAKRSNQRRIVLLIAALVLVIIGGALVLGLVSGSGAPAPSGPIQAWFHLHTDAQTRTLAAVLSEFEALYPEYTVELVTLPYHDLTQRLFAPAVASDDDSATAASVTAGRVELVTLAGSDLARPGFEDPLRSVPWTGSVWRLYHNVDVARSLGLDEQRLSALDWESFRDVLERARDDGVTPIAVGARYSWPWLAWVQHIALATTGSSNPETWERALAAWSRFETAGFVMEGYRNRSWGSSVIELASGKALFLLADDTLLRDLAPNEREIVRGVAFPEAASPAGTDEQAVQWLVGSLFYLVVPAESDNAAGALELAAYLQSEGVAQRLRREGGIEPFDPDWLAQDGASSEASPELYDSLTQRVRDPDVEPLIDWLHER